MSDIPGAPGYPGSPIDPLREQKQAARELLEATKRDLQLVDVCLEKLSAGRRPLELAADVSTEHRIAWVGAVDDDGYDGILVQNRGHPSPADPNGFSVPHRGTIRNQEDAAIVVTDIMVAIALMKSTSDPPYSVPQQFREDVVISSDINALIRFTDANTGRNLVNGGTTGPLDRDRGAIPLSYLSSTRSGLGANFKNKLFSEFTIPRASNIRIEIWNLGLVDEDSENVYRVFVSLLGFKVYGA